MATAAYRPGDDGPVAAAVAQLAAVAGQAGYVRPDPVIGISVGGCVDAIGTERRGAMRHRAHAHTAKADAMRGWLCFASSNPVGRIVSANGRPTTLLRHEVAHLLTWAGHDERWCKAVTALGAPGEARKAVKRNARRGSTVWYWPDPVTGERRHGTHKEMVEATR